MTVKLLVTGVAAAAAIGAGAAGVMSADLAGVRVQPAVFGAPLPMQPPPAPAPSEPEVPAPASPVAGTPLPTPEEVSSMLTRLTDAGIGYKEKGYLVENGIDQGEGHGLDHDLRKAYRDGELPYTFNVLNVVPTTPGQAVATVTTSGPKMAAQTAPITLIDQGTWVISQDSAKALFGQLAPH